MSWFRYVVYVLFFLSGITLSGQHMAEDSLTHECRSKYTLKNWIIPAGMTLYGVSSLFSDPLRQIDRDIRVGIMGENRIHLDDYLIYAPLAADLGVSLAGYKSTHQYKDKVLIYLISTAVNAVMVYPVKSLTTRIRPDESDMKSFPSGHTSNAFVGAEFFWQEYKDKSVWLAASGYLIAATTGYLRIHNDRHWFSDVVAGAGIGILATKLTYWAYPEIQGMFTKKKSGLTVLPLANSDFAGLIIQYKIPLRFN